jgi:polysaccharide pyruvyl transferase WcaK-like protein
MNIAVFGWYHHRNAGDDRLQYCITRWLDGHTLAFLPAGRKPPVFALWNYDAVLIGGGGLIMKRGGVFGNVRRWTSLAGIPVGLIGVSIERIDAGLKKEINALCRLSSFAWFRDHGSWQDSGAGENAFVAPDLSWLYPFPLLEPNDNNHIVLSLRKTKELSTPESMEILSSLGPEIHPWPLYFESGGDAAFLQEILPGKQVPDEFTMDPVQKGAIIITNRFHAIQFAIQSGRKFIAITDQPKTKRFLEENGLSEWCLSEKNLNDLNKLITKLEEKDEEALERIFFLRKKFITQTAEIATEVKISFIGSIEHNCQKPARKIKSIIAKRFLL